MNDAEHGILASAQLGPDTRVQAELPLPNLPIRESPPRGWKLGPYHWSVCGSVLGILISVLLFWAETTEFVQLGVAPPGYTGVCPGIGNERRFAIVKVRLQLLEPSTSYYDIDTLAEARKHVWLWRFGIAGGGGLIGFCLFLLLAWWDQRRERHQQQWKQLIEGYRS